MLKGDASQVLTELTGEYDLVFLDGPKGQYLKQLELILPHVKEGGVILADNVLFRGYVRGDKEPPKRFKTIVKRLKEYLTYVENKELFNTTIYPMGDGMSVSVVERAQQINGRTFLWNCFVLQGIWTSLKWRFAMVRMPYIAQVNVFGLRAGNSNFSDEELKGGCRIRTCSW